MNDETPTSGRQDPQLHHPGPMRKQITQEEALGHTIEGFLHEIGGPYLVILTSGGTYFVLEAVESHDEAVEIENPTPDEYHLFLEHVFPSGSLFAVGLATKEYLDSLYEKRDQREARKRARPLRGPQGPLRA